MPVKKVGKKWEVDGDEFDTEAAAENAYKAKIALRFGVEEDKPKGKKSKKANSKKSKKSKKEDEEVVDEDAENEEAEE